MINKYIFREYDIRGKVAEDFPPDVVENLGKGFGTFVKRPGPDQIFQARGSLYRSRCY